ncbi:phenylacetate--CoA ligase family protein [Flavobacterium psychrophilum]|uniref:phenylacetate--CoA ligase family protein n=1 Tax=Flavobacterium psychrophilum TaxID=96345 RepID=UPI000B7C147C|nr:phenylacetate--CoA ligase family protein [Flavobacterium psychrophilum]EKT4502228.1 phenylacetate--CoA ligase family protein [Flavobacterium psychrophilum]QRE47261.1 phenylacetate--CoA ligase family protein [Flavobacterium psychrophilum]QRE61580.1 phenylacetate--CoA ligase family protein [Flavobacterium psychrophilum]QRE63770.1 phenylacetate--CoA ligase family protein [Flavobacterium psychrophilum]SNB34165.1 putative capsular polysaccharide biosynthesis protein CapK [Flavobacterium psychrop
MFRLFDLTLIINGFPMQKAKAELNKIVSFSEEEHQQFIENKKQEIVNFHLKNNKSYQDFVKKTCFNPKIWIWNELPIMTKKDFQKPLAERISKGYTLKSIYINKTSGSSGNPFIFAKDKYSHALTWASNIYRFKWYAIDFNTSCQARFYGIPLDIIGNKKERLKDFLKNSYRFTIFDLSDEILEKILFKFRKKKFDYINGYTSSIVLFAKFLQKKGIVLTTVCPTLKCCVVTSEMLFPEDKVLMEKQFGVKIINEYGASELDLIAFQNPNDEWQVNAETLFVEILDENNNALPYGKEGRVVITSLFNKAHPFIRYDIGDIGILDQKSTLKKPILKKLIGRTNDISILPSGKKSPGLTFYYVTKSIIEDDGNVKEFVIKQTKIDTFEVEYVSEKKLTDYQIENIEAAIALYLEPNLTFTFTRKLSLERTNRGKLKQFRSLLSSQI